MRSSLKQLLASDGPVVALIRARFSHAIAVYAFGSPMQLEASAFHPSHHPRIATPLIWAYSASPGAKPSAWAERLVTRASKAQPPAFSATIT